MHSNGKPLWPTRQGTGINLYKAKYNNFGNTKIKDCLTLWSTVFRRYISLTYSIIRGFLDISYLFLRYLRPSNSQKRLKRSDIFFLKLLKLGFKMPYFYPDSYTRTCYLIGIHVTTKEFDKMKLIY